MNSLIIQEMGNTQKGEQYEKERYFEKIKHYY